MSGKIRQSILDAVEEMKIFNEAVRLGIDTMEFERYQTEKIGDLTILHKNPMSNKEKREYIENFKKEKNK